MEVDMKRIILAALAVALLLPVGVAADDTVSFSVQVRQRFEVDDKDFNSGTGLGSFNLLRTRIGAKFTPGENMKAFVQLQDSRVWGEEPGTLAATDNVDLHQAFFYVADLYDKPVDLKVGRMEFNLGPQRLIGAVGWSNVGRAFDGAMLRVRPPKVALNFFSFTEAERGVVEDLGDRFLHGMFAEIDLAESYTTEVFWIWQRWVPSDLMNRHTVGFYAAKKGRFHHETEFAYQAGNVGITYEDTDTTTAFIEPDVAALMAAINVGYGFPDVAGKPDVTVGVDFLSGDDNPLEGDFKVFDTLYATNHKYYGFMDYFLNIPVHTGGLGLVDYHGRLSLKPMKKCKVMLDYHYFSSVEDFVYLDDEGEEATSKAFGNEVDLTWSRKYNDNFSFAVGASVFVPGEIFEMVRGEDTSSWFYLMTVFNAK
jgi:hypothetical protein